MMRLLAGVALALLVLVAGAVRWSPPSMVADLRPRPDALEYEEAARSLAAGQGYALEVEGERFPPRFPPGFSLLIAPVLRVLGDAPGTGIWLVWASALVAVVCTAGLAALVAGPAAALGAALLVALLPMHVSWSQAVMSDVPASALVAALAWWAVAALARPRLRVGEWLALGVVLGLGAALRQTCVLLVVPLALVLVTRGRDAWRSGAGLVAGTFVGLLPLLGYQLARFGAPLADGYGYWVTFAHHGWRYVLGRPAAGGSDANLVFYGRQLAGLGTLYPWPVAVLAGFGFGLAVRRSGPARTLALLAGGYVPTVLLLYVPFYWQWDRFLLPALPLLCVLAAVPLGTLEPVWLRAAAAAVLALAIGLVLQAERPFDPPDPATGEALRLSQLGARLEPDAAVIARTNVFFAERFLRRGTDRLWLPIGRCEHREQITRHHLRPYAPGDGERGWIRDAVVEPFDADAAAAAVDALLAEGRPVYLSNVLEFQAPHLAQVVALLRARYVLEPVADRTTPGLWRVRRSSG
jgi:4-amino-4-deoxy-L-arabinose transferase-like glycosyltransferase